MPTSLFTSRSLNARPESCHTVILSQLLLVIRLVRCEWQGDPGLAIKEEGSSLGPTRTTNLSCEEGYLSTRMQHPTAKMQRDTGPLVGLLGYETKEASMRLWKQFMAPSIRSRVPCADQTDRTFSLTTPPSLLAGPSTSKPYSVLNALYRTLPSIVFLNFPLKEELDEPPTLDADVRSHPIEKL